MQTQLKTNLGLEDSIDANVEILGILQHWLWRHDILRRCDHSGCVQVEESWPGVRFHIFSIYDHGICWSESIGRFLQQRQLEMGFWLLCNHLPYRGFPFILSVEVQHSQGTQTTHLGQ